MLIGNTMRFGTDYVDTEFEKMPQLKAIIEGITYSVKMTEFKISSPSIVMRINKKKYYIWLVEPTDSIATPIRIKIGDKTYAIANTA